MMWTPAKLPPHPSTVPTLSPFAQMVLDGLRKEMNEKSKHARAEPSTVPNPPDVYNDLLVRESRGEYLSVGDDYSYINQRSDKGCATSTNSHTNLDFHNSTVEQRTLSKMITQTLYRKNYTTQQDNNHSLSHLNKNIYTTPTFMTQYPNSTGQGPPDFVNKPTLDICDDLSPDMEFEDMEVYSFPQGGIIVHPNNSLENQENSIPRQIPASKLYLPQNSNDKKFHSKETQPSMLRGTVQFQNEINRPKQFGTNNLQPSDQTFIFSDKRSSTKFKHSFGMLQTNNNAKNYKLQPSNNQQSSVPTNSTIETTYDSNKYDRKTIKIPSKEQRVESKERDEATKETYSFYEREDILSKNKEPCSYEMSDLSFENALKKYYNEEKSQALSQSSTSLEYQKSTRTEYLENESRKYMEMNLTSQPEFSQNCESLFTKTQDYDENYKSCLIRNENMISDFLNVSADKFSKSSQEIENSRSFQLFDIDDLFSATDGHLSSSFQNHKPNVVSTKTINNKKVVIAENPASSTILKNEVHASETKYKKPNSEMLCLNCDPTNSVQNVVTKACEQKQDRQNNESDTKLVHYNLYQKQPDISASTIMEDKLTKPDQDTGKHYYKLSDDFHVEELFTLRNEHERKPLHKLKANDHSNRNNKQINEVLSEYKKSSLYNQKTCTKIRSKTCTSEVISLNVSPPEENIPSHLQNKPTKIKMDEDDENKMYFPDYMTQDTCLVNIEENVTENENKAKSKNIKLLNAFEQQMPHMFCDKLNKVDNTKDIFTLLFENCDSDSRIAEKQEKISRPVPDATIQIYKATNKITNHPTSNNEQELHELNNNEDINSRKVKSKPAVDCSITSSNYLPNQVNKNTKLKQSTIFDCKKFFPPDCRERIKTKTDTNIHSSNNIKKSLQFDDFKKPQPQNNKPKSSTKSTNNQCNIKTEQLNDETNNAKKQKTDKPSLSLDGLNTVCKSNYHRTILENKSVPSKMIQTSFVKTQSNKRTTWSSDEPKQKKKPRFTAPVMASHSTSKDTALKNYAIIVIDDVSANEILQRLSLDALNKLLITVTFKEGYTLLNKPENPMKNSRCCPFGIMFMAFWGSNKTDFYWLQLHQIELTQNIQDLVRVLFTKTSRVVCFEAQAVIMLLLDVFHYKTVNDWHAYDPLIGCWLLDPDNPPKDFVEAVSKLEVDRKLLVVNPKADIKTQACDLLPVLDIAMVVLEKRLADASLLTLFSDMEMKLTPLLAVMEQSSILVDVRKLHEIAGVLDKRLKHLQREAHGLAGRSFQLNSHQQLRQILFDELKLDVKFNVTAKQTEQGSKSTSESVLRQLESFHPLPKIVLEFRHLQKIKSTYIDGLIQFVKQDGTIGTVWEQVGAATGRITSKNPNLQAIPKTTVKLPDGESIYLRSVFKARTGFTFLAADFQQIEFRVFAHFTEDKTLLQSFRKGGAIFLELAEHWLGAAGPVEREKTKRIVYSVMYGAGAHKLAEYLQVTVSEASNIITSFVDKFPCLRTLPQTVVTQCRARGYVITLSGRRRLFPNIRSTNYKLRAYSERQAINFLIQGSAADICKAAMLDCDADLKSRGLDAKLLLQIHDELVWEVADGDLQQTAQTVRTAMERLWGDRLSLKVPVPVCITRGKTLADLT